MNPRPTRWERVALPLSYARTPPVYPSRATDFRSSESRCGRRLAIDRGRCASPYACQPRRPASLDPCCHGCLFDPGMSMTQTCLCSPQTPRTKAVTRTLAIDFGALHRYIDVVKTLPAACRARKEQQCAVGHHMNTACSRWQRSRYRGLDWRGHGCFSTAEISKASSPFKTRSEAMRPEPPRIAD